MFKLKAFCFLTKAKILLEVIDNINDFETDRSISSLVVIFKIAILVWSIDVYLEFFR